MKTTNRLMRMAVVMFCAALSAGCSSYGNKNAAAAGAKKVAAAAAISPAAASAISAAKAAIAKAKANHWIWRDTEKFLKQAEAAAKKGDDKKAISLANKAKDQAELAVKQYNAQAAKFGMK